MAVQSFQQTSETLLAHIDAMMRELQALRHTVLSMQPKLPGCLTQQLRGSLGQAAPGELDYDFDIYAQIFDQ